MKDVKRENWAKDMQELFVLSLQLFSKSKIVLKEVYYLKIRQLQMASFQAVGCGWMKSKVCRRMRGCKRTSPPSSSHTLQRTDWSVNFGLQPHPHPQTAKHPHPVRYQANTRNTEETGHSPCSPGQETRLKEMSVIC